jgi:hypothetical protein
MNVKKSFMLIVCLFLFSLFGISLSSAADKNDYYPLTVGSEWTMKVTLLEENSKIIEQKTTIEKPEEMDGAMYSVMKQVDPNDTYTVLLVKNDKGVYWYKLKKNSINSYFNPGAPYITFPVVKGSKWEWNGIWKILFIKNKGTMNFEIQSTTEEVTVPAGKFTCAKVHIVKIVEGKTEEETDWYAPGVGLVKLKSKKMLKELKSYNVK